MSSSLAIRSLQRASLKSTKCARALAFRKLHSTALRAEQYADASLETYDKVVNTKDRIVLVDFYAEWCGPCHQLSPILKDIATDTSVKSKSGLPIDVVKINTENQELIPLAQKFSIRALPTVIAFRDGEPIDQFVGALNAAGVKEFLQRL
ncbi:hypothetical protein D9615_001574 [Tricholomella constricta]|uniref:Thioredoxin domain-containing protein n=1 Tax=Tricholomella constricta TaxID=117010 RepID=A0A8H5HPA3_9AGAR|nr:hypothetical protein D9615_001574 [Tricholomella constricta]